MTLPPRAAQLVTSASIKLDTAAHTAGRADLYSMEANQALESAVAAVVSLCRAALLAGSPMGEVAVRDLTPDEAMLAAAHLFSRRGIPAPDFEDLRDLSIERGHSITASTPTPPANVAHTVKVGRRLLDAVRQL